MQDILNFQDIFLNELMSEEAEFIPLITSDEDNEEDEKPSEETLPILPLNL